MTKKKVGIIGSAVASCAVCASLIVGSTYALFTSESKVDITVSSGKVSVISTIENAMYTAAKSVSATEAVYEEAAALTISEDGKSIEVGNILPADLIEFDIKLENNGTVNAAYQYTLAYTEGLKLFSAFNVTIATGEEEVLSTAGLKSYQSAWAVIESEEVVTYHVTLALPQEAGNEYQGLSTALEVGTFAVQSNAAVGGAEVIEIIPAGMEVYEVNSLDGLTSAINEGGYVVLTENVSNLSKNLSPTEDFVLDLNGCNFSIGQVNETAGVNMYIKNGTMHAYLGVWLSNADSVLTLENVNLSTTGTQDIYARYGATVEIVSGTYEADYIYGKDKNAAGNDMTTNYLVDIQNKTLTDINKNKYVFDSMEYVFDAEAHGVVLKLGNLVSDNSQPFPSKPDEDGYLYDNIGKIAIANRYLLNLLDGDSATITVKGGTFKNFNPANNAAEDPQVNFVAEGYTVVSLKDAIGNIWFTVVSESEVEGYLANGYALAD